MSPISKLKSRLNWIVNVLQRQLPKKRTLNSCFVVHRCVFFFFCSKSLLNDGLEGEDSFIQKRLKYFLEVRSAQKDRNSLLPAQHLTPISESKPEHWVFQKHEVESTKQVGENFYFQSGCFAPRFSPEQLLWGDWGQTSEQKTGRFSVFVRSNFQLIPVGEKNQNREAHTSRTVQQQMWPLMSERPWGVSSKIKESPAAYISGCFSQTSTWLSGRFFLFRSESNVLCADNKRALG